jgi:nucleosome binding factor SPN SPT16 subunit
MKSNIKMARTIKPPAQVALDNTGNFAFIANFLTNIPTEVGDIFLLLDDDETQIQALSEKNPLELPDSTVKVLDSKTTDWKKVLSPYISKTQLEQVVDLLGRLTTEGIRSFICFDQNKILRVIPS